MKLIIQIPCFNEEGTLPVTVEDLPREINGVDEIEFLIIDDGSEDRTREVAKECGVHHITGFSGNRGLARAFQHGLNTCLALGADIIVNTDADNQYSGHDIPKLVAPIVKGEADIVVGDRETHTISHFSAFKKFLQKHGSILVGKASGIEVPDATSGFRAFSREAALSLNVISDFSYTLETLIQAGRKRMRIESVPIRTNEKLRESRLFTSMFSFVRKSGSTMVRVYTTQQPLKVFLVPAILFLAASLIPFGRFLYFVAKGNGGGHVQSLIFGLVLFFVSGFLTIIGVLAELITANRKLIEEILKTTRDKRDAAL
ncbi:MAG: glycosyltransferase family 2 protein [Kiritimatiellae bacterium]|nr:glycosyltransferase family 2 protein [Kiritimatiellia bacterium]